MEDLLKSYLGVYPGTAKNAQEFDKALGRILAFSFKRKTSS